MQQREHFERFVERAETARHAHDRIAFFDEHKLAREEVLHRHELAVSADHFVCLLFEGQHDVEAHGAIATGAAMAGLHDAGGGASDHEPPILRHQLGESFGVLIRGGVAGRARGAEDCHFALRPIGSENRESPPQLAQRLAEDFQVVVWRSLGGQAIGRLPQLPHQVGKLQPVFYSVGSRSWVASVFIHDATPRRFCAWRRIQVVRRCRRR